MKKLLIGIVVVALLAIWAMGARIRTLQKERDVYKSNQTSLLAKVNYWQTENGKSVAEVGRLQMSYAELEDNFNIVQKTAKDLNIKLNRLQSATTVSTNTEVKVITQVRDSIVYVDGKVDSIKSFSWRDNWVDVQGYVQKDDVTLDIQTIDTLVQLVHRVPHKFWFIKWGTKAIKQTITSTNPHAKITYTEYIEVN